MTSSKEQICFRVTPPAYKILTAVTNKFKNESARGWTNSAVINDLLVAYGPGYLKLDATKQDKLFAQYVKMRDGEVSE